MLTLTDQLAIRLMIKAKKPDEKIAKFLGIGLYEVTKFKLNDK